MRLWSDSFKNNEPIPEMFAFGKIPSPRTDGKSNGHCDLSQNLSPHLAWTDLPPGTRSLVLIAHDPDVPSRPDDVNQEGHTVKSSLPRINFYHWAIVDIPTQLTHLAAGEFSRGVTPRGKKGPNGPHGTRQAVNDYTTWFSADPEMSGKYFGYDGPCPPWNDELVHHYHFTLYALDIDRCPIEGIFSAMEVLSAMESHVLAKSVWVGTYTLNPELR